MNGSNRSSVDGSQDNDAAPPQPHALPLGDLAGSDAEEMDHDDHSNSDGTDSDAEGQENEDNDRDRRPRRRRGGAGLPDDWPVDRMDLRHFLRMFAVAGVPHRPFGNNAELVQHLVDGHYIRSDTMRKAMLACPREVFIPAAHQPEAYVDDPIRVDALEFNISAPHMHVSALEALDIQPGDRILDAGCGCGAVTALAAYMAGKDGEVVGMDIKPECMDLGLKSVKHLKENSADFEATACPIRFEQHNVFMPSVEHMGRYDKVHVGATCPEQNLPSLMSLLKPEGGRIIVPVRSELRLITKKGEEVSQEVLLQVRFSDLEVPTDAEILMATVQLELHRQRNVEIPPSTYNQDLKTLPHSPMADDASTSTSGSSDQTNFEDEFGPPDCTFTAPEFQTTAHKEVLKARCELFRAKFNSGMKDADACELRVPDSFDHEAFNAFLQYIYRDTTPQDLQLDSQQTLNLLHIATYYGASRLVVLCEAQLAGELSQAEKGPACESVSGLLTVADENGLQQLKSVALSFIAENYEQVCDTEGYKALTWRQVDMVTRACFDRTRYLYSLLQDLSNKQPLPPPPSRPYPW